MDYTADRIIQLLCNVAWRPNGVLRVFWVRHSDGSRDRFAQELSRTVGDEGVVAIVVRDNSFQNANAVLSDVQRLVADRQAQFEVLREKGVLRVTLVLLAKDSFKLPQGSSPITLPRWFPVAQGRETFFDIADLAMTSEAALLDCPEARIEEIAELTYRLESALVLRLAAMHEANATGAKTFVTALHGGGPIADCTQCISVYRSELAQTGDPRAYRPNAAKDAKSLISRILKLVLNNSPKQLGSFATDVARCFQNAGHTRLKPTLFAVMLRPAAKMNVETANWHAIMLALYQSYQLMNGAAHAGEYPHYCVSLQYVSSVDLRSFLVSACQYVDALT